MPVFTLSTGKINDVCNVAIIHIFKNNITWKKLLKTLQILFHLKQIKISLISQADTRDKELICRTPRCQLH